MAEYIIREPDFSGEENDDDVIIIDEDGLEDLDFIDYEIKDDDEGTEFYRSVNKKFLNGEGTPVHVVKPDIGRLRIESDSESEHDEEEEQILNYEPQEDDVIMPEAMRSVYEQTIMNGIITTNQKVKYVIFPSMIIF